MLTIYEYKMFESGDVHLYALNFRFLDIPNILLLISFLSDFF